MTCNVLMGTLNHAQSLNIHTRSAETFLTFKSRLKTELFTASYDT